MKEVDSRKAIGPDGVSGWILMECVEQLAGPVHDTVKSFLDKGNVSDDWKRANIIPSCRGGYKEDPYNHRPVSLNIVV